MKKTTAQKLAEVMLEIYAEAHTDNTKNYPLRGMLSTMINKTLWLQEAKKNDAANHTAQVQALLGEVIATESEVSGKVTMNMADNKAIGAPHYDEYKVQQHMRFAERDEFEAQLHEDWSKVMIDAFEVLSGQKFEPKAQRTTKRPNPAEWLKKRTA